MRLNREVDVLGLQSLNVAAGKGGDGHVPRPSHPVTVPSISEAACTAFTQ